MNSPKITTYLSTVLITAGFLLILLGWNGAAGTRYVDAQIPFLASGGMAGIGFIVCGCTLAVVQELRKSAATVASRVDAMTAAVRGDAASDPRAETMPEPRASIQREDSPVT